MKGESNIREQDTVSQSSHVKNPTPRSHLSANHEMFNYCLLTLARISSPGWRQRQGGLVEMEGDRIPCSLPHLSLPGSLLWQQQSRSGITNDIMTILHALQTSDVLPTHLLWYLVTDPAVNQGRVMGLEARLPLSLANDLEGNRGCQCLQHVLHWQSSRAPSKTLSYKLCRSLRFLQMSRHWCRPFFFFSISSPTQGLWISLRESVAWVDT